MELTRGDLTLRRDSARERAVLIVASGSMQQIDSGYRFVSRPRRYHGNLSTERAQVTMSEEARMVPDQKCRALSEALRRIAEKPAEFPW